jgi:hypothetical protein
MDAILTTRSLKSLSFEVARLFIAGYVNAIGFGEAIKLLIEFKLDRLFQEYHPLSLSIATVTPLWLDRASEFCSIPHLNQALYLFASRLLNRRRHFGIYLVVAFLKPSDTPRVCIDLRGSGRQQKPYDVLICFLCLVLCPHCDMLMSALYCCTPFG